MTGTCFFTPECKEADWGGCAFSYLMADTPSYLPLAAESDVPSPRTTTMFANAHGLQIADSHLTVAGGDVHNTNIFYHYKRKRDIWVILQAVPNFRKIYQDMLEKATEGTGMWLIKGDKFRVWLEPNGDIKILWGSGIRTCCASVATRFSNTCLAAAGKTVLA
jgi:hypothetical protein